MRCPPPSSSTHVPVMRRLYTRIYLHLLGMLAVVAVVTGAVFATGFRTAWFRGFTERLVEHEAGHVAERWDDPVERDALVGRIASELEVQVTVRDPAGRVLASAGRPLPPLGPEEWEVVRQGLPAAWAGPAGFFSVAPIVRSGAPPGGPMLGILQLAPAHPRRGPSIWRPVLTLALVLVIVAIGTAPLARRISRPVERLTEAMRRFGAGELSHRVPVAGGRRRGREHRIEELALLGSSWNEMADRIEGLIRGQKELLANVSHELRSPIARIRLALELLPRDSEDTEARVRDLEVDLGELDRLIEDVLTASRLEAKGLPVHLDDVEAVGLLEKLVERARMDPATAGREVRLEVPARPVHLVADAALLRRALWNLVENAGRYGAPPITLGATVEGELVHLVVRDEGSGIPPAERARIFEPFYRADKARTPGSPARGFGLGLTIARRVAEVHGGTIRVGPASVAAGVERGCEMVLSLPRVPVLASTSE